MYGVGVAEEVVHITEYLLVGSNEEYAEIVVFVLLDRVHRQHVCSLTVGDEVGYLAVAVAGDVLQRSVACWALVESLYGHDGEELVDSPSIGERLEYRYVAEVFVGKQLVQAAQLVGSVLQCLCHAVHFATNAPIHALYLGTCAQVDNAVREEVESLVAYLLGIVPVLKHCAWIEIVPYLVEILDELVVVFGRFKLLAHLRQRRSFEYVGDEYRVVG